MSVTNKIIGLMLLMMTIHSVSANSITRKDKFFQPINIGEKFTFVKSQTVEIAAGISAPIHAHPVPTFGVINKGMIVFQEQGKSQVILKEGDTFFEPQNVNIMKFNNESNQPAVFTVFYIVETDKAPTIKMDMVISE
ncbi:cupin domain-containing protein [Psychromonas sp. GE-S-Ul-11]|uniref:cupin domain-containing protein n=1 Tax=Psychromonas sp. GE-S-Ul-11 TaxID=3241170 RepID=UPI00390CABE4